MTDTRSRKKNKIAGDALIGIGAVLAAIGFVLVFISAGAAFSLVLCYGSLFLVVIGYLKHIAVALEQQ